MISSITKDTPPKPSSTKFSYSPLLTQSEDKKTASANDTLPMDAVLSIKTGTIVDNCLETVRLQYKSKHVDRDLLESQKSSLALETRTVSLERELMERQSDLLALRAKRASLTAELADMQRQIAEVRQDTDRMKRQRETIAAAIGTLRRQVTSALRAALLESNAR